MNRYRLGLDNRSSLRVVSFLAPPARGEKSKFFCSDGSETTEIPRISRKSTPRLEFLV